MESRLRQNDTFPSKSFLETIELGKGIGGKLYDVIRKASGSYPDYSRQHLGSDGCHVYRRRAVHLPRAEISVGIQGLRRYHRADHGYGAREPRRYPYQLRAL